MLRFIHSWFLYTWGGLHRYFGNVNNMATEHETAVRYFTRAYEVDPSFVQARLARAKLLWRELGRFEEALADIDALLDEDPTYGEALFNRALIAQENGRYQEALQDLEAYLQLSEDIAYQNEATRLVAILREIEN